MIDDSLGLFAKYWQPGQVKTRLAKSIGEERAAAVYCQFICALLERLDGCCKRRWLACTPSDQIGQFEGILPEGWQLESQVDGDLGQRMRSFFERRFAEGCRRIVLLGSDSPHVPRQYVRQAFDQLQSHDVVIGPTEDGGYWLIGVADCVPDIFETIPWSTPQVWSATVEAIHSAGLSHAVLPSWYDVDEQDDLKRLTDELRRDSGREPTLDRLRDFLLESEGPS